ncbi:hypothetical protein ACLOJK_009211 [Asimina triloba]
MLEHDSAEFPIGYFSLSFALMLDYEQVMWLVPRAEGSEWKEKAENLELELQQCYKAQARLSEQLVVEVAECRTAKAMIQEKDATITDLQNQVSQAREECSQLKEALEEKTQAVELLIEENQALKAQLEEITLKAKSAEAENKMLIDRWMLQKMQDAERLNEVNAMCEYMMDRAKSKSIEQLAQQQVDGVVRQSEAGAEYFVESIIPSFCKLKLSHGSGCSSLLFEYSSDRVITGGQGNMVRIWDANTGAQVKSLSYYEGDVLDLAITADNRSIIAANSLNKLFVWDVSSGRINHTLTGHKEKVVAVDASKVSAQSLVSASCDRTMKVWDLQSGYCVKTIMSHSNCNALCFSMDGQTICSGHFDGHLRLWDIRTAKSIMQVHAHTQSVTSVCLSRSGNIILTSGRDNKHNLFDMRSLEVSGTFGASGCRMASNWSRSCISADDSYVAAGSADGSVYVWSRSGSNVVSILKEHTAPVFSCSWSGLGKYLASADKNGNVCIWTC